MIDLSQLTTHTERHPFPLMFATVSGAHLYGFPSDDSDYDLRGIHVLPLSDVVGLDVGQETVKKEGVYDGIEIDLVTHDVRKFFGLMLKKNGYVLEQLFSPLIVHSTPEFEELRGDRSRLRHSVPSAPLSRIRSDTVETVSQGIAASGKTAVVCLPSTAHRHPFNEDRQHRSQFADTERIGWTFLYRRTD